VVKKEFGVTVDRHQTKEEGSIAVKEKENKNKNNSTECEIET
jgi:hypothetical protein